MVGAAHPRIAAAAVLPICTVCLFSPVVTAALCDVDLTPDNRLDVALAGFVEEICCGEKVAVVGDGYGRHLLPRGLVQQLRGFACTVEQAEIGMNVKIHELRSTHGTRF